jgi:hypothetical protein
MLTLTLTDEQAEILGFALARAKADQAGKLAVRTGPNGNGFAADGLRDRIGRLEEVQWLLDAATPAERVA